MSSYNSAVVRVAGTVEQVQRFHALVLEDERARPSEFFSEKVLCRNAAGEPVAREYRAGKSRYWPAVHVLAKSQDAADLGLLIECTSAYESGEYKTCVYRGPAPLFAGDYFCEVVDSDEASTNMFVNEAAAQGIVIVIEQPSAAGQNGPETRYADKAATKDVAYTAPAFPPDADEEPF